MLICIECGKPLINWQKKFCCKSCAATYNNKIYIKRKKEYTDRVCEWCGKDYVLQKSSIGRFCSSECGNIFKSATYTNELIVQFISSDGVVTNAKKSKILVNGHQCEICTNTEWLGEPIALELHHIDGDNTNENKANLQLLCPNCHSQTDTYRGKNIPKQRKEKVSDEDFMFALLSSDNIRQSLLKLNLTPKSTNYERAYRLKYINDFHFTK